MKLWIVAVLALIPTHVVLAADLGIDDIGKMTALHKMNKVRFNREYIGRSFSAKLPIQDFSEHLIRESEYSVSFGNNGFLGDIQCDVKKQDDIRKLVSWNKGDFVVVSGTVSGYYLQIKLDNCSFEFAESKPSKIQTSNKYQTAFAIGYLSTAALGELAQIQVAARQLSKGNETFEGVSAKKIVALGVLPETMIDGDGIKNRFGGSVYVQPVDINGQKARGFAISFVNVPEIIGREVWSRGKSLVSIHSVSLHSSAGSSDVTVTWIFR